MVAGATAGAPFRSGVVILEVSDGLKCDGLYDHIDRTKGYGLMNCADGTIASFSFTSDGRAGGGTARIQGEAFAFRFVAG